MKFKKGDCVGVTPLPGDFLEYEWCGTVIGFDEKYVNVKDPEGNVFECSEGQLCLVTDESAGCCAYCGSALFNEKGECQKCGL